MSDTITTTDSTLVTERAEAKPAPTSAPGKTNRIYFVDVARSVAIMFALFNHSANDFHVWDGYGYWQFAALKILTSAATPIFLFLFGMMIEIIYFKRLQKSGMGAIRPRLIKRSMQCYLGFMLTALASYLGGLIDLKAVLGASMFATNVHYGNILKLYSVLILLVIFLLMFRQRFGVWATLGACLAYWVVYPFTRGIEFGHPNIGIFVSTFTGVGSGTSGPTMFNSLSIIALGMLCGHFVVKGKSNRYFIQKCLITIAILAVPIAIFMFNTPFYEFMENYLSNTYRRETHPIYYLVSCTLALFFVIVFALLVPIGSKLNPKYNHLLVFGRNSLASFTIGNIILNLFYPQIKSYEWNIFASIGFLAVVYIIVFAIEQLEKRQVLTLAKRITG